MARPNWTASGRTVFEHQANRGPGSFHNQNRLAEKKSNLHTNHGLHTNKWVELVECTVCSITECADGVEMIANLDYKCTIAFEILQRIVYYIMVDDLAIGMGDHISKSGTLCHLAGR